MANPAESSLGELAAAALDKCGTGPELARKLSITKSAVSQWKRTGIPAQRLPAISQLSGIAQHDIRPDLFLDHQAERRSA